LTIIDSENFCKILFSYLYAINQETEKEDEIIATYSTIGIDEEVRFNPRKLKNLDLIDEIQNLCCITDLHVEDLLNEGSQQIYTLCGRGARSTLRVLKPGLTVTEIANSNLPGAIAIWTLKGNINDEYHKYAVVSFHNSTKVLAIGEKGNIIKIFIGILIFNYNKTSLIRLYQIINNFTIFKYRHFWN